ncbi:MAG: glycosyltransferase [Planctomycetota bacterium]
MTLLAENALEHGPTSDAHRTEPGNRPSPADPLVTIALPVYNGERYVREAIDSILAQSFTNFELLISDNASTDSTPQIIADYARRDPRVRLHRNERNLGAAENFNLVVELARGDFFKWAAYDDVLAPDWLKVCVEALEREPDVMLVQTRTRVIDDEGRPMRVVAIPEGARHIVPDNPDDPDAPTIRYADAYDAPRPGLLSVSSAVRFREITRSHWMFEQFGLFRLDALRSLPLDGKYERPYGSNTVTIASVAMRSPIRELEPALFLRRYHQAQSDNLDHDDYIAYVNPDSAKRRRGLLGKATLPGQVRGLLDYLQQVRRSGLPLRERLACYGVVVSWCFWLVKLVWTLRHERGMLYRLRMKFRKFTGMLTGRSVRRQRGSGDGRKRGQATA